jgi:flagellar motor switch protein FliN/FliY
MASDSQQQDQATFERLLAQSAQADQPAAAGSPASAPAASPEAVLRQEEIEALLASGKSASATSIANEQTLRAADALQPGGPGIAAGDVEYLLQQAEAALASINAPAQPTTQAPVMPFKLQDFSGAALSTEAATLDLVRDVELDVKIELGRTQMYLEDVLKLRKGAVVPLDKLAGDPVDIYVNGRLIARGEVLVLNENFCVRVAELVAGDAAA